MLNNVDTNDDGDDGNNHDGLDKAQSSSLLFSCSVFYLCIFAVLFFPFPPT